VGSDSCKLWIKFATKSSVDSGIAILKLISTDLGLSSLRRYIGWFVGDFHFAGVSGFAVRVRVAR
jgi:hypothetical protein